MLLKLLSFIKIISLDRSDLVRYERIDYTWFWVYADRNYFEVKMKSYKLLFSFLLFSFSLQLCFSDDRTGPPLRGKVAPTEEKKVEIDVEIVNEESPILFNDTNGKSKEQNVKDANKKRRMKAAEKLLGEVKKLETPLKAGDGKLVIEKKETTKKDVKKEEGKEADGKEEKEEKVTKDNELEEGKKKTTIGPFDFTGVIDTVPEGLKEMFPPDDEDGIVVDGDFIEEADVDCKDKKLMSSIYIQVVKDIKTLIGMTDEGRLKFIKVNFIPDIPKTGCFSIDIIYRELKGAELAGIKPKKDREEKNNKPFHKTTDQKLKKAIDTVLKGFALLKKCGVNCTLKKGTQKAISKFGTPDIVEKPDGTFVVNLNITTKKIKDGKVIRITVCEPTSNLGISGPITKAFKKIFAKFPEIKPNFPEK